MTTNLIVCIWTVSTQFIDFDLPKIGSNYICMERSRGYVLLITETFVELLFLKFMQIIINYLLYLIYSLQCYEKIILIQLIINNNNNNIKVFQSLTFKLQSHFFCGQRILELYKSSK